MSVQQGYEFEEKVFHLLKTHPYFSAFHDIKKPDGQDKGVDFEAKAGVDRIGIQAKCYTQSIGRNEILPFSNELKQKSYHKAVFIYQASHLTSDAIQILEDEKITYYDYNSLILESAKTLKPYQEEAVAAAQAHYQTY